MMTKLKICLIASAGAFTLASSAQAGTLYMATLNGANENPPTTATFTGTGFLVLNDAETQGVVTATHNINITLTGGHIHRGPAGVNGPIIFPFADPNSPVGPLTWAIPAADLVNLKTAGLYMNFHTTVNPGGAIRGQLLRVLLAPSAADASQTAVANALDVSAGYTNDLDNVLKGLAVSSTTVRAQALGELSGATIYAQGRQAMETMRQAQDDMFRQAEMLAKNPEDTTGGFVAVGDTFGKRDTVAGQAGSKISRPSVLVGLHKTFGAGATAGFAVGYADGKDKFRGGLGRTQVKTTSAQMFVSGGSDPLVFTGTLGYGWSKVDTSRNLSAIGRNASSSHDAKVWAVGAKVSAPLAAGGSTTISPYARVDLQHASIDAYAEAGAGSAGLVVPKRKDKNAAVELGASLDIPMSEGDTAIGGYLQAGWRHMLEEGDDAFATAFSGSPVSFQSQVLSQGKDAAHISAGVNAKLGENLTGSAGYTGVLSKRTSDHSVQLKLTLKM